ncbi:hypothetical protein BO78DRAFT_391747 [Aspergillus sclerotiicarbonarius CBS 121057]|uniref:Uncharacterized protein n=1 Tax=Aspergillus sclerotiicarbonarius (strain CBS 121057 / IBT 28362) TaxID=1448318 RepID=A0A319DTC4_ASPSB|nr:hypothetical protein BO78DRAFT_391747 [Aspergillus sclerotiicarbonarius CBS 121057]
MSYHPSPDEPNTNHHHHHLPGLQPWALGVFWPWGALPSSSSSHCEQDPDRPSKWPPITIITTNNNNNNISPLSPDSDHLTPISLPNDPPTIDPKLLLLPSDPQPLDLDLDPTPPVCDLPTALPIRITPGQRHTPTNPAFRNKDRSTSTERVHGSLPVRRRIAKH